MSLAAKSNAEKRHGCIIVKGGSVLGTGFNKYTYVPWNASPEHFNRCSIHAEIAAMRQVKRLKGSTVYVARINNQGKPCMSAPCSACQSALDKAGVKKVVYTV